MPRYLTWKEDKKLVIFILANIVILFSFFFIAYWYKLYTLKKKGKHPITIIEFLNTGKLPSLRDLLVGLSFGIVFGFLDNFGLWMGMDSLGKYIPGNALTKSAWGNTYSDFLGATTGTFIAIMAEDYFNYNDDNEPIWINTVGIFIGCILGMIIGKMITGKS